MCVSCLNIHVLSLPGVKAFCVDARIVNYNSINTSAIMAEVALDLQDTQTDTNAALCSRLLLSDVLSLGV